MDQQKTIILIPIIAISEPTIIYCKARRHVVSSRFMLERLLTFTDPFLSENSLKKRRFIDTSFDILSDKRQPEHPVIGAIRAVVVA